MKLKPLHIKSIYGITSFFIQKQSDGTFHFQMDSCETDLKRSELKQLLALIQDALKD